MFGSHTLRRLAGWMSHVGSSTASTSPRTNRSRANKPRSLRMEGLEQRELLSVSPVGAMTFKEIPFTATGKVNTSFRDSGYLFQLTGDANLVGGKIKYDSVDHGVISTSAALTVKNGTYTATQKNPNFSGSWGLSGKTLSIADQAGQLSGGVYVASSVMNIPTVNPIRDSFKGTYTLKNATLNAKNFDLNMDLVNGGTKINFDGTFRPTGNPFDVQVFPGFSADGSAVNVTIRVPGQPHKTANRGAPVTSVKLYWAKGTALSNRMSALADTIPVYWNEAAGRCQITNLPSAPTGATHLLFVTTFDGVTRTKALALRTISIGKVSVSEGDPANPKVAKIKVTLSQRYLNNVTVSYTTFKGPTDTAIAGVDYQFTRGSITIPKGTTVGEIPVPIIGDRIYERVKTKTFSARLTGVKNAVISKTAFQAVNTIVDDDPVPTISITPPADAFYEGTSGSRPMSFDVALSNPSYQTITVNFNTADGTATAGQDYTAVKTTRLTFKPGEVKKTISVAVIGDSTVEPDETFNVILSGATSAYISQPNGRATGTIKDGDAPMQSVAARRSSASNQLGSAAALSAYFDELGHKDAGEGSANLILAAY